MTLSACRLYLLTAVAVLFSACLDPEGTLCDEGNVCGDGFYCGLAVDGGLRCFAGEGPTIDGGGDGGGDAGVDAGVDAGSDAGTDAGTDGGADSGTPVCEEGTTQPCGTDEGQCVRGIETCVGGIWSNCTHTPPADEICNGLDDDCDGETDTDDEGQVLRGSACGLSEGVCAGKLRACVDGGFEETCSEHSYGLEYEADFESRCDGLDNDCNGLVDVASPRPLTSPSVLRFRWAQVDGGYAIVMQEPAGGIEVAFANPQLASENSLSLSTRATDFVTDVRPMRDSVLVAWMTDGGTGGRDVMLSRVHHDRTLAFSTLVESLDGGFRRPSASSNHEGSRIAVIWKSTDHLVHGRVVNPDGGLVTPGSAGRIAVTCSTFPNDPEFAFLNEVDVTSWGGAVSAFLIGCTWGNEGAGNGVSIDQRSELLGSQGEWVTHSGGSDMAPGALVLKPATPAGAAGISFEETERVLGIDKATPVGLGVWSSASDFGPVREGTLVVIQNGTEVTGRVWPNGTPFLIATDVYAGLQLASGDSARAAVAFRKASDPNGYYGVVFCSDRDGGTESGGL